MALHPAVDRCRVRAALHPAGRVAALQGLSRRLPCFDAWQPGGPDLAWIAWGVGDILRGRPPSPDPDVAGATLPERPLLLDLAWQGEWEVERARRLWRETVLPRLAPALAPLPGVARLELVAARFDALLAAGRFDGAPAAGGTAGAVAGPGPAEPCLEMPIRLLQECWPGDEFRAEALGLAPEAVSLRVADAEALPAAPVPAAGHPGGGTPLLVLTAYDGNGAILQRFGLRPTWSRRRYLDAFPQRGWVHPPTGWLRAVQDGRVLLDCPIATDPECFWEHYQTEVPPAVRRAVQGAAVPPERSTTAPARFCLGCTQRRAPVRTAVSACMDCHRRCPRWRRRCR